MEELRSTDILDKEIQEDARKKAERILKNAEEESKKIINSVQDRLDVVRKDKEKQYEVKAENYQKDTESALPLEEERYLVAFQDNSVNKAINDYMAALSEDKKVQLLQGLVNKYKPLIKDQSMKALVYGFSVSIIEKMLKKELGSIKSCTELTQVQAQALSETEETIQGCILENEDGTIKCRVLLSELIKDIKDRYSYELASTLFGGRLPE